MHPNTQAMNTKFNVTINDNFRGVRLKARHKSGVAANKLLNNEKSVAVFAKSRNMLMKTTLTSNFKSGGNYDNSYDNAKSVTQARTLS